MNKNKRINTNELIAIICIWLSIAVLGFFTGIFVLFAVIAGYYLTKLIVSGRVDSL